MKTRWESPPVTFNGKPLETHKPRPRIKVGPVEKMPKQRRKPTQAELDAVSDVTDIGLDECPI